MPAWFYVLAVAAVAFVAWFAFARRWAHALWYSWTRARHLAGLTQTEVIPGAEYLPYAPVSGRPPWPVTGDWREQTAAELSPEALNPAGFLRGLDRVLGSVTTTSPPPADPEDYDPEADVPFRWLAAPPDDPGPGDSSSASPGPDQVLTVNWEAVAEVQRQWDEARLADTGEIRDAHLLAEVAAELRAQDDDARAYCSALERDRQTYMHQLREVFA